MDSKVPCYFLLNMKVIWLYTVSAVPPITITMRGGGGVSGGQRGGGDLIWKFAKILWWQNFFLHLWQDKPLWVKVKPDGEVIFITILLYFHYLISLETANTQKSEVFLLRISLGIVNACVTCRYLQIYNFSFRKEFLETLLVYLSKILGKNSTTPFVKNSRTSCVSSL